MARLAADVNVAAAPRGTAVMREPGDWPASTNPKLCNWRGASDALRLILISRASEAALGKTEYVQLRDEIPAERARCRHRSSTRLPGRQPKPRLAILGDPSISTSRAKAKRQCADRRVLARGGIGGRQRKTPDRWGRSGLVGSVQAESPRDPNRALKCTYKKVQCKIK